MYYIGKTKGLNGVGFLVKKKYKENIKTFIGISERVCMLEIELENIPFAIIQAYAPTESSSQEDIDNFYEDLAKALWETLMHKLGYTKNMSILLQEYMVMGAGALEVRGTYNTHSNTT